VDNYTQTLESINDELILFNGKQICTFKILARVREESKEVKPFRAGIELPVFNLKSHKLSVSDKFFLNPWLFVHALKLKLKDGTS